MKMDIKNMVRDFASLGEAKKRLRLCQGGQPVVRGDRRPGAVLHEHDRPRSDGTGSLSVRSGESSCN